jgi:hypothetical protein
VFRADYFRFCLFSEILFGVFIKNLYPRFQESYQEDELIEHFWLTNDEITFVENFRSEANRQATAILLKSLDHLGCFPDSFGEAPKQARLFIARQLNSSLWDLSRRAGSEKAGELKNHPAHIRTIGFIESVCRRNKHRHQTHRFCKIA